MAPRGECAASGASAVNSAVSALESGSTSAVAIFASSRRRNRLSIGRKQPRDKALAVEARAVGQVDDDLQPFVETAARLARAAERVDEPRRIERHDPDRSLRR